MRKTSSKKELLLRSPQCYRSLGMKGIGQAERAGCHRVCGGVLVIGRLMVRVSDRCCRVLFRFSLAWMGSPQWGQTSGSSYDVFPFLSQSRMRSMPAGKANMPTPVMATMAPTEGGRTELWDRRRHSPPSSASPRPTTWQPECLKTRPAVPSCSTR